MVHAASIRDSDGLSAPGGHARRVAYAERTKGARSLARREAAAARARGGRGDGECRGRQARASGAGAARRVAGKYAGRVVPEEQLRIEPLPRPSGNLHIVSLVTSHEQAKVNIYNSDGSYNLDAAAPS